MFSLVKKDLRLTFVGKVIFLYLLFYVPFIVFLDLGDMNLVYLASVLLFTYFFVSIPFQYEMKNKTHILFQSLPLKKISIVIGRYIYSLIGLIFSIAFTYVYLKVLIIFGVNIKGTFTIDTLKQTVFIVITLISVLLLIHSVFSFKTANFLGILSYVLFFTSLSTIDYAINKTNLLENNSLLISVIVVVIFLLSLSLSTFMYSRRNFS